MCEAAEKFMMGSIVPRSGSTHLQNQPNTMWPPGGPPAFSTRAHIEAQFHGTISKFIPTFYFLYEKINERKKEKKRVSILGVLMLALLAAGFSTNNGKLC